MIGPEGNSEFYFPSSSIEGLGEAKTHCFPLGPVIKLIVFLKSDQADIVFILSFRALP